MKDEYKKDFKQISAILPNAEADAVKRLLKEKKAGKAVRIGRGKEKCGDRRNGGND